MTRTILCVACACAFLVLADNDGKPDLSGTWQSSSDAPVHELTIAPSGDSLHVTESRSDGTTEWTCGTAGQQCDLGGVRKGTVSAWYNGSALVILETKGSDINKQRLELSSDKSTLTVELIPVVPPGKTEKAELRKR